MVEVKIIRQSANELLKRKEVSFEVEHRGAATPSKRDIRSKLAALLAAKEELLIVDSYFSNVGAGLSSGVARLYSDEKMLASAESKPLIRKNLENKTKKEKKAAGGGAVATVVATTPAAKPAAEEKKNAEGAKP